MDGKYLQPLDANIFIDFVFEKIVWENFENPKLGQPNIALKIYILSSTFKTFILLKVERDVFPDTFVFSNFN